ncbi:MAG TPA: copper oxidase [Elusimicrobiota bacterium]|jgi:FtsP/CotA-like multicopper oxidase with cupredoxin domain|nr:copper oxidase [Elusimicrobiota bacterium]
MKTLLLLAGLAARAAAAPYVPVVTPDGATMPWTMDRGVKVFKITVGPCEHEVAPGMTINAWCYNGRTPGPTIEAVEGDRVRFLVTNHLPEGTAVHWHSLILPNGMDGVAGLTQPAIPPGKTFVYEFTLRQHGTFMYHSHGDEMVQIALGAMGFFIIHPKKPEEPRVDRDFAIMLNEWYVPPGGKTPDPSVMTDFNLFTFNSRAYPGTAPLLVKRGDRVRIRFGNVGQESHPIHLHGYRFTVTGIDGGDVPKSAQWTATTVDVSPGETRDVEFVADADGDWPLHCHRRHHPMNAMGHGVANMLGVDQSSAAAQVRGQLPQFMPMGRTGMGEMSDMAMRLPENTLPMMGGEGQFGPIGMGGMFTVLKVRDKLPADGSDPGWYHFPKGTVAHEWKGDNDE